MLATLYQLLLILILILLLLINLGVGCWVFVWCYEMPERKRRSQAAQKRYADLHSEVNIFQKSVHKSMDATRRIYPL